MPLTILKIYQCALRNSEQNFGSVFKMKEAESNIEEKGIDIYGHR